MRIDPFYPLARQPPFHNPSVRKKAFKIVGLALLGGLGYAAWRFGPAAYDLWKGGYLFNEVEMREYQGTSKENLKALYTAMMLYHASEDAFPPADVWMDRIQPYLRTGDLSPEEALKKFRNPLIRPSGGAVYGYAMNDAFSSKHLDDVRDSKQQPLIFDSREAVWNAHGKPSALAPKPPRQGGNLEVTGGGDVRPMTP